jgi:DNA end-binding protein Ku
MPHTIWSGAISFGLVNIPVKVSTAVSHKQVRFHQLHDEDGVRIKYQKVCPADGEEVPPDHIVKGFEVGPDEYVTITREELEALDPKGSHTIDIESFAELSQKDPQYLDKPKFLNTYTSGAKT